MNLGKRRRIWRHGLMAIVLAAFIFITVPVPQPSYAIGLGCKKCHPIDCNFARQLIGDAERNILRFISREFMSHRWWFVSNFLTSQILPALKLFTEQMSVMATHQVFMIGTFLDAKNQLETQRLLQEKHAEAHKDYMPSESFCAFGTNVRSLAASEENARFNMRALAARQTARHLGRVNTIGAENRNQDKANRWRQFTEKYCDPQDNNYTQPGTGLSAVCLATADTKRVNIDVDYTRLIDAARTLNVTFNVPAASIADEVTPTADEEDVLALGNNLFGHDVLLRMDPALLQNKSYQHLYLALRSVAAKRSVAENSYNSIVAMKSAGSSELNFPYAETRQFLAAIMRELGVPASEVYEFIGENPSYYAQLEILAKRIYQNTDFYANLYDKPANVQRKAVALKAIELMLDRAIFESQLRQEMAMSVLLSSKLREPFRSVNRGLPGGGG